MALNLVPIHDVIVKALGGGVLWLHHDFQSDCLYVKYQNNYGVCSFRIPERDILDSPDPANYIIKEIEKRMPTSGTCGGLSAANAQYQQIAAMQQQMNMAQQAMNMQNMAAGMGIQGANSLLRVGTVNNDINVIHRINSLSSTVDKPEKVCETPRNAKQYTILNDSVEDLTYDKETKVDKDVLPDISLTRALKWAVVALIALALGERVWKAFGEKLVKNIEQTIAGKKEPVV